MEWELREGVGGAEGVLAWLVMQCAADPGVAADPSREYDRVDTTLCHHKNRVECRDSIEWNCINGHVDIQQGRGRLRDSRRCSVARSPSTHGPEPRLSSLASCHDESCAASWSPIR
jgi:hypothetical protein